jgi:hypothetical protein
MTRPVASYNYIDPGQDPALRREAGEVVGFRKPDQQVLGAAVARELVVRDLSDSASNTSAEEQTALAQKLTTRVEEKKKAQGIQEADFSSPVDGWAAAIELQAEVASELGSHGMYAEELVLYAQTVRELSRTDKT